MDFTYENVGSGTFLVYNVKKDDVINTKDITLLRRYVAGYDVELGVE